MKGRHWRIENDGQVVTDCRIIYVDEDGNETDVSTTVQRVEVDLAVGNVSRAVIHAIFVDTTKLEVKEAHAVLGEIRTGKHEMWKAEQIYRLKGWVVRQLSPQLQREIARNWKRRI